MKGEQTMVKQFFALLLMLGLAAASARAGDLSPGRSSSGALSPQTAAVNAVLDDFHDAADKGDKDRYLGHFAEGGVFMGTDDWERWPLPVFRDYVAGRFKDGQGWSYKPVERHVAFSQDGRLAWFDEITVSEKWGRFRGTGVLQKQAAGWKIAHYAMSMLIPNDSWMEISALAKQGYAKKATEAASETAAPED